jgi:hypothetical protein
MLCEGGRRGRRRGGEKEGRGNEEEGEGEEERKRDEGTRKRAKEVALTAGGKAAGARVIGG